MHGDRSDQFFELLWNELRLLLPNVRQKRLVDLGCGDGSFYAALGFEQAEYEGVDLSQAMLDHFAKLHPGTTLRLGAAQSYASERPVDLVFSHGVIQYLSKADLKQHFDRAQSYLSEGGHILHAGIPWKRLRREFELGGLWHRPAPEIKHLLGYVWRGMSASPRLKGIGYWYSPASYRAIAASAGFDVEFFGSLAYPYRFHALSTRRGGAR
jgi:cyclopropane fatty-acyl-phospholipid synthase-like methyltransferase